MHTLKKVFDIFIPKPTIEVECFTDQRVIYEAYGPELARDNMPDWWKSMPSTRKTDTPTYRGIDNATLKRCPHVNQMLTTGIIFPAWLQLHLKTFDQVDVCEVQTYPENVPLIPHDPQDYAHHKPGMFHGKVMSPWQIREKSGIDFIWTSPAWHQKDPLKYWTCPAITEFKYQHATIVNLMVPFNSEIKVEVGDPWLQLIPLSDKRIKLKTELVTTQELAKLNSLMMGLGSYQKFVNRMKRKGK